MPFRRPHEDKCPACESEVSEDDLRCSACDYGLRPRPYRKRPPPRTLGARRPAAHRDVQRLECELRCPCCGSFGAQTREVEVCDVGHSRRVADPRNTYLAAHCLYCAAVQLFDLERIGTLPAGLWTMMRRG